MKKIFIVLFLFPIAIFVIGILAVVIGKSTGLITSKSPEVRIKSGETSPTMGSGDRQAPRPIVLSKPNIKYSTEYYDVFGSTRDEIRASMEQKKMSTFLEGHDAATISKTTINFAKRQLTEKCDTVLVQFDSFITYVYPRWDPPAGALADLVSKWNAFQTTLKIHEEGHAKIETDRIHFLFREFISFSEYKMCDEFDRVWRARADAFDAESIQLGAEYDRATQGGKTQGASF